MRYVIALRRFDMRPPAIMLLAGVANCTGTLPDDVNTPFGLYLSASVTPSVVSVSDSTAALTIRIYAHNESDEPIIVVTGGPPYKWTPDPVNSSGLNFAFRISRPGNPLDAGPSSDGWGSQADTFPPHHSVYAEQQVTLVGWREGGWATDTGTYTVRSYYNGHEGTSATFRLAP